MKFIKIINSFRDEYKSEFCGRQDSALLYGKYEVQPPLAKHIVYLPMPEEVMQNMISSYKGNFPNELLTLYRTMNGADLYWMVHSIGKNKIRIPRSCLSIYGVPLTYDRKHIEPYNICIEDLNRPEETPNNWLKFGSYYRPEDLTNRLDLYVDTCKNTVYSVENENMNCIVVDSWDSIDHCLCGINELLKGKN